MKDAAVQHEIDFNAVLKQGWRIYTRYFVRIAILTTLVLLPINLFGYWCVSHWCEWGLRNNDEIDYYVTAFPVVKLILSVFVMLMVGVVVDKERQGERCSLVRGIEVGLNKLPVLLLTELLALLIILLMSALMVVPGILFYVLYSFAGFAVILRGVGFTKALGYSRAMVKGRWWKVFGFWVFLFLSRTALQLLLLLLVFYFVPIVAGHIQITIPIVIFCDLLTMVFFMVELSLFLAMDTDGTYLVERASEPKGYWKAYWMGTVKYAIVPLAVFYTLCWFVVNAEPGHRVEDSMTLLNKMNCGSVTPEDNGWSVFEKAYEAFEEPNDIESALLSAKYGFWGTGFDDVPLETQKKVVAFIDANRRYWDSLPSEKKNAIEKEIYCDSVVYETQSNKEFALEYGSDDDDVSKKYLYEVIRDVVCMIKNPELVNDPNSITDEERAIQVRVLDEWVRVTEQSTFGHPVLGPLLKGYLDKNQEVWDLYEEAAGYERIDWPYDGSLEEGAMFFMDEYYHIDRVWTYIDMSQLGKQRARYCIVQGEYDEALRILMVNLKMAKNWSRNNKLLIEQMCALGGHSSVFYTLIDMIEHGYLSKEQLLAIRLKLQEIVELDRLKVDVETYIISKLGLLDATYSDGLFGGHALWSYAYDVHFPFDTEKWSVKVVGTPYAALSYLFVARKDELHRLIDEYKEFSRLEYEHRPYWHAENHSTGFRSENDLLNSSRFIGCDAMIAPLYRPYLISYKVRAHYEATLVVIGLELWHDEHGAYPDRLEQLVEAGTIEAVPMDPFGAGELTYKIIDGGYVLYSWGDVDEDYVDHGGVNGRFYSIYDDYSEEVDKDWIIARVEGR